MNIAEAKEQILDTVDAYLEKDESGIYVIQPSRQRPIFLLGAPGIGKTAIMEQIAHELGIGLVSYSMTHHTRQSALGLPRIVHHDFEGLEYEASEYTMSEIIASIYDYMSTTGLRRGILFLDEINCVSETLYPSMLQFLQFKTFGRHRVPDDWIVVCAGNPTEYNKSAHEFDIVTMDRMRKVEVEPDYGVWKVYATNRGLHPAVTSYLDAKRDDFYLVESLPGGGKTFVTARGWEDLAQVISLFEKKDKRIDRNLIGQFVQNDEIADRFMAYYQLFAKYRSDYQVESILAGEATPEIVQRASEAQFDERLALLNLILDSLTTHMGEALALESVIAEVRDILRTAKPALVEGGTVADVIDAPLAQREAELARKAEAGTLSVDELRRQRQVNALIKQFSAQCVQLRQVEGPMAFDTMNASYRGQLAKLRQVAPEVSQQLDCVFDFLSAAFDSERELLVFMTELTARNASSQFIAKFGNERYFQNNDRLMVSSRTRDLQSQIDQLMLADAAKGAGAGSGDGDVQEAPATLAEQAAQAASAAAMTSRPVDLSVAKGKPTAVELGVYYAGSAFEYGFASFCHVALPENLRGCNVLDIGCRRGRGVYKISSRVGATGLAIGIDWVPGFVEEAERGMERAWIDSRLPRNNMEFHLGYPEDLAACGISDNSMDYVYINSVVNLCMSPQWAFAEALRVLRPGGTLVCETVLADVERDQAVVAKAKELGNSVQAAPSRSAFEQLVTGEGFEAPAYSQEHEVAADAGFEAGHTVETAASEEAVTFTALVATMRKPA